MRKFYAQLLTLTVLSLGLFMNELSAQDERSPWTLGASVGAFNYYGDVSDYDSFDFDGINLGGAVSIERRFGQIFVPQLQLAFTQLESRKTALDAQFEAFYAEATLKAGIDVVGFLKEDAKLQFIPFGGFTAAYYDPTVTRGATGEVIEASNVNEGENIGFGLAFGGSLGYRITPGWRANVGLEMRYFLTDQVDGYRGLNLPEGSESANDWLSYISVGVGYTFKSKDRGDLYEEPEPLLADEPEAEGSEVNGQFTYNGIPKSGVKLDLYDQNNVKQASSTTDINGNFKFDELEENGNYVVKLSEDDKGLYNGGKVYIVNDKNQRVALAEKPEYNVYTFTQLGTEDVNSMPMLVEDKPSTTMEGVFVYEELPAAGVQVYLMDDDGNRIDSTVTRSDGSFKFSNLDPEKAYLVKLSEDDASKYAGADMFFLNENNEPVVKAGTPENGSYTFTALEEDRIASLEPLKDPNGDVLYTRTQVQEPPKVDLGLEDEPTEDVAYKEGEEPADVKQPDKPEPKYAGNVSFEKETIYFRHNSFWITQNQQGTKGSVIAQKLKDNPGLRIRIEGWASPPGNDDYNLSLSQKRADKLKELLVSKYGIDPSRIDAVGKGEVKDGEMSEEESRRARIIAIK